MISAEILIEKKMRGAGVAAPAIRSFLNAVQKVRQGETGLLPEADVEPITSLPRLDELPRAPVHETLLAQLAVVKLNGGLGTSMGLDQAKSLIPVKGPDNFLDFIARQILHLRAEGGNQGPAFYLMDSFSTQADTLAWLRKYPALGDPNRLDFLQNRVPKLQAQTLLPVSWPEDPELEWCPPGHGDLYPALLGSGLLRQLLDRNVKYLFVSNSDNLGATVDLHLASYFAQSEYSFLMEVAERTTSDRKGGHLTRRRRAGRLVLRESVQCPKPDEAFFQDIQRHRYFNTNNLWIRLDHLALELERGGGALALPLITNLKTVNPRKPDSPQVLQLESAMGAAIECFASSGAIVVPRTRFSPVKTTADLLALRSDAYGVTSDHRLVLAESRHGQPPLLDLDSKHYKLLADFEALFPDGAPSLVHCEALKVRGKIKFEAGVVCKGQVEFVNPSSETRSLAAGEYCNIRREV